MQSLQLKNIPQANFDKLALLKRALVTSGYHEIISFSFVDQAIESLLNPKHDSKVLANPISQELSVMRSSIWPGLIKTAQYNLNRQQNRIRLFEHGLQFVQAAQGLEQLPVLAGLVSGLCHPEQWSEETRAVDFYDLKGDVEQILEMALVNNCQIEFEVLNDPALHSGQAAKILLEDQMMGRIGKLHPRIQSKLDIDQPIFLFELQLHDLLKRSADIIFQPMSKYPSIRRDITFIVDETISAKQICANIEQMEITMSTKHRGLQCLYWVKVSQNQRKASL